MADFKLNAVTAKARAMYGRRLKNSDYNSLLNMKSVSEVALYLKNQTAYSDVFEKIDAEKTDTRYIEYLVKKKANDCFEKLCRYEMFFGEKIYNYFIVRTEVDLILSLIRAILSGRKKEYIITLPDFYSEKADLDIYALSSARSIEQLHDMLKGTKYGNVLTATLQKESCTYTDMEIAFDYFFREYEKELINKTYKFGKKEITDLLIMVCDLSFINKVLRIKKYFPDVAPHRISLFAHENLTALTSAQTEKLVNAPSVEKVTEILSKTKYRAYVADLSRYDYIEYAEEEINFKFFTERLRFSRDPNVVMFSFIYLMNYEATNIIRIAEGINHGLSSDEIAKMLIGVSL